MASSSAQFCRKHSARVVTHSSVGTVNCVKTLKAVKNGGLDQYDWVYKANIAESTPKCVRTFANHNRFHGASGQCPNMITGEKIEKMTVSKYEVEIVKSPNGGRNGETMTKYNLCTDDRFWYHYPRGCRLCGDVRLGRPRSNCAHLYCDTSLILKANLLV